MNCQEVFTDAGFKKVLNISFTGIETEPKLIFTSTAKNSAHPNKIKAVLYVDVVFNYERILFK